MQDEISHSKVQMSDGAHVTVPARIMEWLRRAAYAEIGSAAEALNEAAFDTDREAHPEWFRVPAVSLQEIYALLDTIGWSKTIPPDAVQIDLHRDCWALMRALSGALEFADEDIDEAARRDVEHARQDQASERVGVLWAFIAEARARIDELAVQEGAEFVLDIAA